MQEGDCRGAMDSLGDYQKGSFREAVDCKILMLCASLTISY